jgi:hypothetical protein
MAAVFESLRFYKYGVKKGLYVLPGDNMNILPQAVTNLEVIRAPDTRLNDTVKKTSKYVTCQQCMG